MKKILATTTILTLASAGTWGLTPGAGAATSAGPSARTQPTEFALQTSGFGTRVRGGQVPAGSGSSAYQVIGCTNAAGKQRDNVVTEETLPGLGTASQVKTLVWTERKNGVTSSNSRNTIARVELADTPMGSLSIDGIRSVSRAFHDDQGFHATTSTSVASIVLTPAAGPAQEFDVPTPGQPLEIPGVATITVGRSGTHSDNHGANAHADALFIESAASGSKARIAKTDASIHDGVVSGIFGGYSSAVQATGLQGNVTNGRTPYSPMPCQGTDGKVKVKPLASVDLGGQVVVGAVENRQMGKQNSDRATGFEQARVASLNLGGGQLVVEGIKGRVEVTRTGDNLGKLLRNTKGSTIGSITANGQAMEFPDTDVLEIPGVARLERNIVKKLHAGIRVTALEITLLDGSGAVIDLGRAQLRIQRPVG